MFFHRLAIWARRSIHLSTYFFLILLLDLPFLHLQHSLSQKSVTSEDEDIYEDADTNPEHRTPNSKIKDTGRRVPPGRTGDDLDNDEFVGADQGGNKAQPSKDKISFGPMDKQNYYPEIGAILFLILYGINFLIGRRANDQIADAWIKAYRNIFELQFASVGFAEVSSQGSSNQGLLKESPSSFKYYATGRRHCHAILATLDLRKRHDLFSLLLAAVDLSTTTDTLNLEIPMNDTDMEPFVFAIVRRKHERKIRKATKDLENYSGLIKNTRLPASLCLLTDCPELDREFLDEAVINVLKEKEELFASLHFTDQNTSVPFYIGGTGNKKMLKFKFNIPKTNEMEDLRPLIKMALHFIDRVASKRLSTQARTKAIQQRKIVAEKLFRASHAQRQEALTKRKEDLRKKEEENVAELSPEALRRREAREHKAALKKKQPKVKIMR